MWQSGQQMYNRIGARLDDAAFNASLSSASTTTGSAPAARSD